MRGEISFDGVFLPSLLVIAIVAGLITMGLVRLANAFGLYRFVAYRAIVDLSLFIITLGLLVWASQFYGISS